MTEPVSAIVACPVCNGWAHVDNAQVEKCFNCNGTGLVRIRALAEDVPTIDRVPRDEDEYMEPGVLDNIIRTPDGRRIP